MTELAALVKSALADLHTAPLILADWLDENDPSPKPGRASRGVLLRRRWKEWRRIRALSGAFAIVVAAQRGMSDAWATEYELVRQEIQDESFRRYLRERFAGVRVEDVSMWFVSAGVGHAVIAGELGGPLYTACLSLSLGTGHLRPAPYMPARICRKCRAALATMSLTPKEGVPT